MYNNDIDNIKKRLNSVDWNFTDVSVKRDIHSIHPYPAKFIPQIPYTLMKILGVPENTVVLDPFCGSGTTLVEAQRMGIDSYGVDLNPIACLLSKTKTSDLCDDFLDIAAECVKNATVVTNIGLREIKNVNHWFKQDVQEGIQTLLNEFDRISDINTRDTLKLCLSSIIVKVSNQESDTRYAAVAKNVEKQDVYKNFLEVCTKLYNEKMHNKSMRNGIAEVLNKNILDVSAEEIGKKVGLVITSPPYPNAYEYWLYHKYRMYWLGFDADKIKEQEIGARPHYFKKNAQTIDDFIHQMKTVFELLNNVVISGGYICVIIGRSVIKGKMYDNATIIEKIAQEFGMEVVENIERVISSNRKSFNLHYGKIKTENIVIIRKK